MEEEEAEEDETGGIDPKTRTPLNDVGKYRRVSKAKACRLDAAEIGVATRKWGCFLSHQNEVSFSCWKQPTARGLGGKVVVHPKAAHLSKDPGSGHVKTVAC